MAYFNGESFPFVFGNIGGGGGEDKAALVRLNATHELEVVGNHIYLLDESNTSTLEASCNAIYSETAEYIVFVKKENKYYFAQTNIHSNKLRITYNYFDSADGDNFKSRTIIWNPNGGANKLSFESRMMYAQPEDWDDEEYYYTSAPTVEAVQEKLDEKQDKASTQTITIAVADWTGGTTVTKSVMGVTASNIVIVDTSDGNVECTAQGSGTLTFTAKSTPTSAVTAKVVIL